MTFQDFFYLLCLAVISGIAKVIYDYRSSIALWLKRQKLALFPVNFNLALSLDFQEGLNSGDYFKEIKKNILQQIDKTNLSKQIIVRDFSDIIKFTNKNEAEAFRQKKSINLIVWGGFSGDKLKIEGEHISKVNLNFTYPNDDHNIIGSMIQIDISSKFAVKDYWQIADNSSLRDTQIVSGNIFDLSTYIIALTLKLYGFIIKSKDLFDALYKNLIARNDVFSASVKPHLIDCYRILIENYTINKDYNNGKKFSELLLSLDKTNFVGLANLALCQWKTGETDKAEKTIDLLASSYSNNPLVELDIAFIRLKQKRYDLAFKHYSQLRKHQLPNFNSQQVIEFLEEEYKSDKDPVLLYASGIVSFYFGDKKTGIKDLRLFIKRANESTYNPMYKDATKLVI